MGVKCTWKRVTALQPALHSRMFVGGVVVADQVDLFFCGDRLVDHAQETSATPDGDAAPGTSR